MITQDISAFTQEYPIGALMGIRVVYLPRKVRFLVDMNFSPAIATGLGWLGHDAVHVRDIGLHAASDRTLFTHAAGSDELLSLPTSTSPTSQPQPVAEPSASCCFDCAILRPLTAWIAWFLPFQWQRKRLPSARS